MLRNDPVSAIAELPIVTDYGLKVSRLPKEVNLLSLPGAWMAR